LLLLLLLLQVFSRHCLQQAAVQAGQRPTQAQRPDRLPTNRSSSAREMCS
jgi:hypothetical protein